MSPTAPNDPAADRGSATGPVRHRGRTAVAVALVVIGLLVSPFAVVSAWARSTLTDTDRFVATYAPLADDPAVQAFLTDQVVAAVDQAVDIDQLTNDLVDGLVQLGAGPRTTAALEALRPTAVQAIDGLMRSRTEAFIDSDAFAAVWREALRATHTQATATLAGDPGAVVVGSNDGTLTVQLRPIVAAVRDRLVAQGFALAARVPDIDRQVEVATVQQLPSLRLGYELVLMTGAWLAPIGLAFVVGGVLVAVRRRRAVAVAAVGEVVAMAVLAVGVAVARAVAVSQAPASVPGAVVRAFLTAATAPMVATSVTVALVAVLVAVAVWVTGPAPAAVRVRRRAHTLVGAVAGGPAGGRIPDAPEPRADEEDGR
ncbi:hypothetical protein [Cellulomonas citrea]|uniref:hypothetical protein n=1 Tax=Cellulomonas citrea TaxID=1909423 RepID=UPI001357EC63|nr:hypothetical protein [Cellulomonas citrea]